MKKCAIYSRVSTEFDSQKSSIANQEFLLDDFIKRNGWTLYKKFSDNHTATKGFRKEFEQMLSDARDGKIDLIIAKDVTRLSRNQSCSMKLIDLYSNYNVDILTLDGMINTPVHGSTNLSMWFALAELNSQDLSNKLKASNVARAKMGLFTGSIAPYGYNCSNGILQIREDNTPDIVRRIFNEYLSGKSLDSIAKDLTKDNVPTPGQSINKINAALTWHGSTVRCILQNEHYCGKLIQNRTTTRTVTSSKRIINKKEDYTIIENTHDAIISQETFILANKRLKSRRKHNANQSKNLYTDTLYCKDCGRSMHFKKDRGGYVCGNYNKNGKASCSSHFIKEAKLSELILDDINNLISSSAVINLSTNNFIDNALDNLNKRYNKAKIEKNSLISQRKRLTSKYSNDLIKHDAYIESYDDITEKINSIETTLLELTILLNNFDKDSLSTMIENEVKQKTSFNTLLPSILHRFVSKIYISDSNTLSIHYNC